MDKLNNYLNTTISLNTILLISLFLCLIYFIVSLIKRIGIKKMVKFFIIMITITFGIFSIISIISGMYMFYMYKMLRFLIPVIIGIILLFIVLIASIVFYFNQSEGTN